MAFNIDGVTRWRVRTPERFELRERAAQSMGEWPGESWILPLELEPARWALFIGGARLGNGPVLGIRMDALGCAARCPDRPGGGIRLEGLGAGGGMSDDGAGPVDALGGGSIDFVRFEETGAFTSVVVDCGFWQSSANEDVRIVSPTSAATAMGVASSSLTLSASDRLTARELPMRSEGLAPESGV